MQFEDHLAEARRRRSLPPGTLLRTLRRSAGLSQEAVAEALGVTRTSVCRYELGERRPTGDVAQRYARVIDQLAREVSGQ